MDAGACAGPFSGMASAPASSLETYVGGVPASHLTQLGFAELQQPTMKSQLETQSGDSVPELASLTLRLHSQSREAPFHSCKPEPCVGPHASACACVYGHMCVPVCTCAFARLCCSEQCFSHLTPRAC